MQCQTANSPKIISHYLVSKEIALHGARFPSKPQMTMEFLKQPDLVSDIAVHGWGLELDDLYGPFQTKPY